MIRPDNANAQTFVSLLSIDPLAEAGCNPARVHVIYGASKDWGANGFRIGCLISQANPQLHTAMESSCLLMKISSPAVSRAPSIYADSDADKETKTTDETTDQGRSMEWITSRSRQSAHLYWTQSSMPEIVLFTRH